MNRRERIDRIVRNRTPYSVAVTQAKAALRTVADKLERADHLRREIARQLSAGPVATGLTGFSFGEQGNDADRLRAVLDRIQKRFGRGRLQIGVLGRARQGKSTLLQRLTGLDDTVIPSGNTDHCTGARSVIVNDPDARPPFGVIRFLTPDRFLAENVLPYYQFFSREHALPPPPTTLDEFSRADLRSPRLEKLAREGGNPTNKVNHLRRLQAELPTFRGLLGQPDQTVAITDVRRFVAQLDARNGRQTEYLAVDHAEIRCPFPRAEDVGGIGCVDMPGLGDTGLGQEELLVRTMAEEIDLVLFTRKPDPDGDHWKPEDLELFHVAERALGGLLPIGRWMVLLLNRRANPSNDHTIVLLKDKREKEGILVARTLEADCSDPADVAACVLDPLLDLLEKDLGELDGLYLRNVRGELAAFARTVQARCAAARQLVPPTRLGGTDVENELLRRLHREFDRSLPVRLGQLLAELSTSRGESDPLLRTAVEAALGPVRDRTDTALLPTAAEMSELHAQKGGWPGAVQEAMNRMRSGLTNRLLGLDVTLHQSFADAKTRVVGAIEAAGLTLGTTDPARLEGLAREAVCPQLAGAFHFLAEFRLTYFGFIHHRIRQELNPLTPDANPLLTAATVTTATEAVALLSHSLGQAIYQIDKRMKEILVEPSVARFAMVEEFCDQVLRRMGVQEEWEQFTRSHGEQLWPGRFDKARGDAGLYREWAAAVGELAVAASDPALRLQTQP